jgi:hypothetical protein
MLLLISYSSRLSNFFKFILTFSIINYATYLVLTTQDNYSNFLVSKSETDKDTTKKTSTVYFHRLYYHKNFCKCKIDQLIEIKRVATPTTNREYFNVNILNETTNEKSLMYNISWLELSHFNFTCDFYKSLRRGRHQKVLSLSISNQTGAVNNTDRFNYENLNLLLRKIHKFYPGWIVRVYYNSSDMIIDPGLICDLECGLENLDFCNINDLRVRLNENKQLNVSQVLSSSWSLLPIGESFVDLFVIADMKLIENIESIIQKWHDSKKPALSYNSLINGFLNINNREMANVVFDAILNSSSQSKTKLLFNT